MVDGSIAFLYGFWYVKIHFICETRFRKACQHRAHNGQRISFWDEVWCGNIPLKYQFPLLYLYNREQQSSISDKFEVMGGKVTWDFSFVIIS